MKTGAKSLLFGVHQFIWHPITVVLAWRALYGSRPNWKECVAIVVHDWGYWSASEMDGPEGELHPYVGAAICGFLFGPEYYDLVLLHSRSLAKKLGKEPSRLCWPDKFSMCFDPTWFYLPRARASGELREYRVKAHDCQFIPIWAPHHAWHQKLVAHLQVMAREESKKYTRQPQWIPPIV